MEILKSISFILKQPLSVEKWLTEEWKQKLYVVKQKEDIPYLIFFGEVLKILDNTENIFFESSCYDESSVYGPNHEWTLQTENLKVSRDHRETLSDSWQSIDVISNSFVTQGFPSDFYIDWNGSFLGGIDITFGGISESIIEHLKHAAENIFKNPSCEIKNFSEEKKLESKLKGNQQFLNRN